MIDLCFDRLLYNLDISWVEEDWAYVYNTNKQRQWPPLKTFADFETAENDFKEKCRIKKLDPESHKIRTGLKIIPYPNCTRHCGTINESSWGEFSQVYPNTDYFRLIDYFDKERIQYKLWNTEAAPNESYYCVSINTYHLDFDYLGGLSAVALRRIKHGEINLLFFYHEGDNPHKIREHIDSLCKKHSVDANRVFFISGNTHASKLKNFYYFFDDELLYKQSVNSKNVVPYHEKKRNKKFTALVRIDKLWRSIFMAHLWKSGIHHEGYFSYNQISQGTHNSEINSQPFNSDYIESQYRNIQHFLASGPFKADDLNDNAHNSFENIHGPHYENSYCNFVVETHFELESEIGTTLTEKIIKPICHNQFFVVIGPAHTLKKLKELGYKTFSRCIDESYDSIEDSEERMNAVIDLCIKIGSMPIGDLHKLYKNLKPEITHNSKFFAGSKKERLINLLEWLND